MKDSRGNVAPLPEGWHTVTPRIVVADAKRFVDFLKRIFAATGEFEDDRPSVLRLGDSIVMVTELGVRPHSPAFLYVYVSDTEATFQRAVQAGATVIEKPLITSYGDLRCMVEDAWGNVWQIATYAGSGNDA